MAELKKGSTVDGKVIATVDQIEGLAQVVAAPRPTYPTTGEQNVPISVTLSAGNYLTSYPGLTRTGRQFQVCKCDDGSFGNPIFDLTVNSNSAAVAPSLIMEQGYSWRCRDIAGSYVSEWSEVQSFTTGTTHLITPTLSVSNEPNDVPESPVLSGSNFNVSGGSDTHVSTDWEVRKVSDDTLVWSKTGATGSELRSIVVPAGFLSVGTEYKFRVRYHGATYTSQWGGKTAKTRDVFFGFTPDFVGKPYGGGYYAGNIKIGNQEYAIVAAPKTQGGESPTTLQWKTSNTATANTGSINDGKANTAAMIAAGAAAHPAASFCNSLTINGYNDWYLPAKDELEILYRAFKPTTQQNNTSFGTNTSSVPPRTNYTGSDPAQTSSYERVL